MTSLHVYYLHYITKATLSLISQHIVNSSRGIDRFHFQSHLESKVSNEMRIYLFTEAEKALHSSLTAAVGFKDLIMIQNDKLHDQFSSLVHKTQQLYVDKWLELGARAFDETISSIWNGWINTTAPLSDALKSWTEDVKSTLSEHTDSPLKIVVLHHLDEITQKYDAMMKKIHWEFDDVKSTFINDVHSTFQSLAVKSKGGIDDLTASCQNEIRELWLSWHLQFMPIFD